jgi:hypothetical protein
MTHTAPPLLLVALFAAVLLLFASARIAPAFTISIDTPGRSSWDWMPGRRAKGEKALTESLRGEDEASSGAKPHNERNQDRADRAEERERPQPVAWHIPAPFRPCGVAPQRFLAISNGCRLGGSSPPASRACTVQRHFGGRRLELLSGYRAPPDATNSSSYHQSAMRRTCRSLASRIVRVRILPNAPEARVRVLSPGHARPRRRTHPVSQLGRRRRSLYRRRSGQSAAVAGMARPRTRYRLPRRQTLDI